MRCLKEWGQGCFSSWSQEIFYFRYFFIVMFHSWWITNNQNLPSHLCIINNKMCIFSKFVLFVFFSFYLFLTSSFLLQHIILVRLILFTYQYLFKSFLFCKLFPLSSLPAMILSILISVFLTSQSFSCKIIISAKAVLQS